MDRLETATIAELQAAMETGELTSRALVEMYLHRIATLDRAGPRVNAVIEINPDAGDIAAELDRERRAGRVRGPLHGIPVMVKDNIDSGDRMQTTAGSLALVGQPAPRDATVLARLRAAGAVLLGKTNLSEWANFRSTHSSSGWSGRGGQTRNPHVLDRTPSGSSSGSAAAAAAAFAAATLGTETDGSIISPSHANGVVGIKPTVGLTSRAGVVPIAHSQDTVGPHARCVADAATVLGALVGVDPRDPATAASAGNFHADYRRFLDRDGLRGARIGIARRPYWGYSDKADRIAEEAIRALREAGAVIVDPADLPSAEAMRNDPCERTVLHYEFKHDLNAYLATRVGVPVRTLADVIRFNEEHAAAELKHFGQEHFLAAEAKGPLTDPEYLQALERSRRLGGAEGIDAVMAEHRLDALFCPSGHPAVPIDQVNGERGFGGSSSPSAKAGYPMVTVPAGFDHGLPVGVSFIGRAWSEPTLIRLAYAFEQATRAWRAPRFLPSAIAD
jgi:amidase